MKKLTLVLLCFMISIGWAFAQEKEVSGVVISAEDNQPLIGAAVFAKGSPNYGQQTNLDGKFRFTVPESTKTLVITYVGMKRKEVPVGQNLRIVLETDSEQLDEVVVVAYGVAKKQSLVGSQANVSAKQLEKRPISNISNALAAAAPGVQVTTSSGQPGSSASVRIRGFGSVNASSAPLYVVDGAVYNGSLQDIAPQDIQSFSILKDAASTALYGSSAGNGVILITTKSGARGDKNKPRFTFTTRQGFSRRGQEDYEKVDAMQYYPLRWQQWYNQELYQNGREPEQATYWANYYALNDLKYQPYAGIKTGITQNRKTRLLETTTDPEKIIVPLIVMSDGTLNPEVTGLLWGDDLDWEKDLFQTGYRQEYIVSGGLNTDKMKSYLSASMVNEDGYKVNTSLKRLSLRANLSYDVTKWLSLGTNTTFSKAHSESPKMASGGFSSNSFNFIRSIAPIYPIHLHNTDGSYVLEDGEKLYDYSPDRPYSAKFNPIYEQDIDKAYGDRDAISSRSFIDFKILPELKFTMNMAYDLYNSNSKRRFNNIMGDQPQGLLTISNVRSTTFTHNQLLTYSKTFGDHTLEGLIGHESYDYESKQNSMSKQNMLILGVDEMSNLTDMSDIGSSTLNYRKEGYLSRMSYTFSDLYNISVSYRRDGTSRLHPSKRWGNFWSIGIGWHIGNETFMTSTKSWLNMLKLRASIGQTGNDNIGTYYAYQTLFNYGFNNENSPGLRFRSLGNPDLRWETQTSYDLAIEFGLFHRLSGTVEFFNKESKDLLFAFPLPASTGIGDMNKNIGKVRNYGVELDLKFNILHTQDFNWDVNWNGTIFKNKIISLPEENREDGIELAYKKYIEGGSVQDYYLNAFMGVDSKDGLAMYLIDNEKYPDLANPESPKFIGVDKEGERAAWTKDGRFAKKHFCGSSIPDIYGGFGTNLNYKGIDLSLLFAYQLGGKSYDGGYQNLMGRRLNSGQAMHVDMLKAWRQEGDITDVPRLDAGVGGMYDNQSSDRFLISASALMLKNISIGYSLPKSWTQKLDIANVRLGISAENLFLLSKRKGLNPMTNYSGVSGAAFYDYAKTITANISVSF